jgi:DNA-binding CsgD family transcriptional regulator
MININQHPVLLHASDIKEICRPLIKLNISYFSHVNIDQSGQFSAVSNHPEFHKHYLEQGYYHADIHLSEISMSTNYVIWDALECSGTSEQMNQEADELGIRHSFTIIDKNSTGHNFYHYSTHIKEASFNQTYLSNLDLLKMFITHFNESMSQSKKLIKAYQFKFSIEQNMAEYAVNNGVNNSGLLEQRADFMREISLPKMESKTERKRLLKNHSLVIHKETHQAVALYRQQMKCLTLLMQGHTAREIANQLNLSHRTINHYLEDLRGKLGCRSSKELIAAYYMQIMRSI